MLYKISLEHYSLHLGWYVPFLSAERLFTTDGSCTWKNTANLGLLDPDLWDMSQMVSE